MAQTPTGNDLYTHVKNVSGGAKHFGYLGAHGRDLDADEVFLHPGDLVADLAATSRRKFEGLIRSLTTGALEIVKSPAHYIRDAVWGETQKLGLSAGDLGTVDPSWNENGSSTFDNA